MLSGSNLGISIQKKKKKTDYFNIFSHIAHYSRKLMCKYKRKGSISQRYSLKLIAFSFLSTLSYRKNFNRKNVAKMYIPTVSFFLLPPSRLSTT